VWIGHKDMHLSPRRCVSPLKLFDKRLSKTQMRMSKGKHTLYSIHTNTHTLTHTLSLTHTHTHTHTHRHTHTHTHSSAGKAVCVYSHVALKQIHGHTLAGEATESMPTPQHTTETHT